MPRTAPVIHVTYPTGGTVPLNAVLVHTSKNAALEHAAERDAERYVPVRPGESLQQAVDRYGRERHKPAGGMVRGTGDTIPAGKP